MLIDLAIAYFHAAQYDKALNPLSKAASRSPNNAAAHHMLGKTHFMLGNFEKATAELEHALKLSPNDYDVAYTLGLAYLKQHKMQLAKADLRSHDPATWQPAAASCAHWSSVS